MAGALISLLVGGQAVVCLFAKFHGSVLTGWLLQLAGAAAAAGCGFAAEQIYTPAPEPAPPETAAAANPGFAQTALFFGAQTLDHAASRPVGAPSAKGTPPEIAPSGLAWAALALAVASAVIPGGLLNLPLVMTAGILPLCRAARKNAASRGISYLGNWILLGAVPGILLTVLAVR
jgi:hypothetical protein